MLKRSVECARIQQAHKRRNGEARDNGVMDNDLMFFTCDKDVEQFERDWVWGGMLLSDNAGSERRNDASPSCGEAVLRAPPNELVQALEGGVVSGTRGGRTVIVEYAGSRRRSVAAQRERPQGWRCLQQ